MADIFRKEALDSANADEKLDKMMIVTPKSLWLAILGGVFIIVVVVLWSIYGVMPTKVTAKGIYVPKQKTYIVDSEVNGIIETVNVKNGDNVKQGDVLYVFNSKTLQEEIDKIKKRIETVETITPYSKDDVINDDTQSLIEIKYSIAQTNSSLSSDEYLLDLINDEIKHTEKEVSKAKDKFLALQSDSIRIEEILDAMSILSAVKLQELDDLWSAYDADNTNTAKRDAYKAALDSVYANAFNPDISPEKNLAVVKANNVSAKNNLNEAEADYEIAKSKLTSLENQVISTDMEISSGKESNNQKVKGYIDQFNGAKEYVLNSLNGQIDKYKDSISKNTILCPVDGVVSDVKVAVGSAVGQGSSTIFIRETEDEDVVVCYVAITDGKKLKEGMMAKLYPSNVDRYEYGNIEASVLSIDEYVTNVSEIRSDLGDDTLTEAFLNLGPVVGVKFKIEKDDTTLSGYKWSSKKARDITIPDGTIVDADIITEEKKPITMLIPYLREQLETLGTQQPQQ